MLTAKENFLKRISSFEKIVAPSNPVDAILVSKALTETEYNDKVRMLRNGMAIIGYTILEDFVKKRMGEVFKEIGRTTVQFNALPMKLRDAATMSALKGVQVKAEALKRNSEDYMLFVQDETKCISSTKESVFEISEFSLGWEKSNLTSDDITTYLGIFNVKDGWNAIQSISSSIDINLTNPSEIFKNAAARRHKAAHNADADSLLTELDSFISQAKVIAFSFDALLSKSLYYISNNNPSFLNGTMKTEFNQLSFRFLKEQRGKWREIRGNSRTAFRVKSSFDDIFTDALNRAKSRKEILLVKSENNQIVNWYIN